MTVTVAVTPKVGPSDTVGGVTPIGLFPISLFHQFDSRACLGNASGSEAAPSQLSQVAAASQWQVTFAATFTSGNFKFSSDCDSDTRAIFRGQQ